MATKVQVRHHTVPDYAWSRPGGLVERPGVEPGEPEAWLYCDKFSYFSNERVSIKTHTTAETYDIEIIRDGFVPKTVFTKLGLPGQQHPTPTDAYATGCGWPEALSVDLDTTWESGFYLVIIRIQEFHGRIYEREGFFILRPRPDQAADADFVLVHASSTMLAYNDWGGANHYRGVADGYQNDNPTPISSTQRPIARGMLRLPSNAPRATIGEAPVDVGLNWTPRYPNMEYSWFHRYSRHYADAGWATYERPFVVWAEQQGYKIHHLSQLDLHSDTHCLDGYSGAVSVGHDEYWTAEMRDRVDNFVDRGGIFARFGGNFIWQVRLDSKLQTQTCYKIPQADPEFNKNPAKCTTAWDLPPVNRPGAQTMGLTGMAGIYVRYGTAARRASGGFQIYRPHHWALKDLGLGYGDLVGANPVNICGYEVDGVDYTFRKGLPYPTGEDGAPMNLEIIGMCPALVGEPDNWQGKEPISAPRHEFALLDVVYPDGRPEHLQDVEYGSGMMASFTRNKGEVFCAGTSEWVVGLIKRDAMTEGITRNVLHRLSTRHASSRKE